MTETVFDGDIMVTMRGVADITDGAYTVNPFELCGFEALVEIREGGRGDPGGPGGPAWAWSWQGDVADYAAAAALGLGLADVGKAYRVVDENAVYYWTGESWIRFEDAFGRQGDQGPANVLTAEAVAGATGSTAGAVLGGSPPAQHLTITLPRGITGPDGPPGEAGAISDAADVGDLTDARDGYVLAWDAGAGEFVAIPPPGIGGPWAIASAQFAAGSNIAQSPRVLATMTIPGQPYAWRPFVMSGSVGMMISAAAINDTRVDIEVRVGSQDGAIIGYGFGCGVTNLKQVQLFPRYDYPASPDSEYGIVGPNQTGALYIMARRTVGTRNYSITNAGAFLVVGAHPIR